MYQRTEHAFARGVMAATMPADIAAGLHGFGRNTTVGASREFLPDLDLVVDLGARIGTLGWWRGLVTLGALLFVTYLLAPVTRPIIAPSPPAYGESEWSEARAQAIQPLADGADTGRRMGPTNLVQPLAETPERPQVDLTATVGMGDGFARVLSRAGVADAEAEQVAAMVGQAVSLDDLKAGTRIDLTLGRRVNRNVARPLDHLLFRAAFDLKLQLERIGGKLRLERLPIPVDDTPLRVEGSVGSSLYLAARQSGAPVTAVEAYLRALATRTEVGRDIDPDDRFDLIVAQRRAATGETQIGDLLYAGLDHGGKRIGLMRWVEAGRTQWFEQSGVGETTGAMRMPVAGHITSSFGLRFHPILGFTRMHQGVDYGAPMGTPIVAATEGTIVYAGWHGGHGNFVQVKQSNAFGTGYGHMSRIVAQLGEHVQAGQLIGYVGMTGLATGPHLHFEVYENGHPVDPTTVKFSQTAQLSGADLAAFRSRLAALMAVQPGAPSKVAGKVPVLASAVAPGARRPA